MHTHRLAVFSGRKDLFLFPPPRRSPSLPKRQPSMLLFISPLFISLFVPLSLRSCNKIAGFLTSYCLLAFQMDLRDIPSLSRSHYTSNSPTFQNAKWLGTNHDYKCGKHLCLLLTMLGIFCCKLYLQTVITLPKAAHSSQTISDRGFHVQPGWPHHFEEERQGILAMPAGPR